MYKGRLKLANQLPDYYAILGVSKSASQVEITQAYRRLASRYHPDRHHENELRDLAEEKLALLNDAYAVLSKPQKRKKYDASRQTGQHPPQSTSAKEKEIDTTRFFRNSLVTLLLVVATIVAMRFIHNPRALIVIALAVLIARFGPRIVRRFKKNK